MSQANIPNITPLISVSVEQTVPLLLASIALEELALAHIINAKAEELQLVLGTLPGGTPLTPGVVSVADLLAVDASVQRTLRNVIKKEMLLEFKFENVLDLIGATAGSGSSGSVVINPVPPVTGTCPITIPISGTLLGALGLPLVGAAVTLEVIGASGGANITFSSTTPVTDIFGNFSVLGTATGVPGVNTVTIRASATTPLGVTVSTILTITFTCDLV